MLSCFVILRSHTYFHGDEGDTVLRLSDEKWVMAVAFTLDITTYLNDLNVKLHGKSKLLCDTCSDWNSFKARLSLLYKYIREHNLRKFLSCNNYFRILRLSMLLADTEGHNHWHQSAVPKSVCFKLRCFSQEGKLNPNVPKPF